MTQPTFSQVRQALADRLASIPSLNTTASRFGTITPPTAVILPVTGTFIGYSQTLDGEANYTLRAILLVSEADSASGQDLLDTYLAVSGASSVWAAVQADPTLGAVVSYAAVMEATGYGVMNWNGIDYLACSVVVDIGT